MRRPASSVWRWDGAQASASTLAPSSGWAKRSASTDRKVSLNAALRDYGVPV